MSDLFATNIKFRRNELGKPLREVAPELGITFQYLHRVEKQNVPFPINKLKGLAKALEMNVEHLFGWYMSDLEIKLRHKAGLK